MISRRAPRALVLAAVAAAAASCASIAIAAPAPSAPPTDAVAPAPTDAKPADLKEARSLLAKAASPADYAAMLDSFSTSLPPSDALALLDQGIAQAGQGYRRALLVKAAGLDLLVGLFGDAASRYEAASSSPLPSSPAVAVTPTPTPVSAGQDLGLLLRAARCYIAAGDSEKASALSADVIMATEDSDLAAASRLVGAWALAMQGRAADASALASAIAGAPRTGAAALSPERRREARFILWLCAAAADKAAAAAVLASEFPGSPEALIAAGSASAPPLPHWYLGGLGAVQAVKRSSGTASAPLTAAASPASAAGAASASTIASASPAPGAAGVAGVAPTPDSPNAAASSSSPTARAKRLQVGYFSKEENARALEEELATKGFTAVIEARMRPAGAGKAEEKRWIVVVDGGKDIAKTLQSLKDAGYESYVID